MYSGEIFIRFFKLILLYMCKRVTVQSRSTHTTYNKDSFARCYKTNQYKRKNPIDNTFVKIYLKPNNHIKQH